MKQFENTFFDIIGNVVRYLKVQPINLGGYAASGGGAGGPPGGFFGYLPQTRVAYDYSEAATAATPASGISLLDNLNHIRSQIGSGAIGINAYEDGDLIAENAKNVYFIDHFNLEEVTGGVTVSLLASGTMGDTPLSGVYGENLSTQIDGIEDHFTIAGTIHDATLAVYFNGLRQNTSNYAVDGDYTGFTTTFVPVSGDTLFVDYLEEMEAYIHTHHQYLTSGDVYTREETLALMLGFSRTVNQQIVFTIAGSGALTSGTKPLRVYAHDVNDSATISEIFVSLNTPPATTEVRMNVLKNGSTIFTAPAYVAVPSGQYTGSKTTGFDDSTFVKDDYFQIKVEQGDNTASDMTLHVRFSYELD